MYDVSNASRRMESRGVEIRGHIGEVGAINWSSDGLATASDDGTVRVWRPDVEVHRKCIRDPGEEQWNWCWANDFE